MRLHQTTKAKTRVESGLPHPLAATLHTHAGVFRAPRSALRARTGFTLIEILVVVGVIIFLVAISLTVIGSILSTTREKATRVTLFKVRELLVQRQEAFQRWADDSQQLNLVRSRGREAAASIGLNPNTLTGKQGGRVLDILGQKVLFREQFPQQSGADGAEALYLFLTSSGGFDSEVVAADAFSSNEIADTDGDGQMELVDAWGNPLHFYRWPTAFFTAIHNGPDGAPDGGDDDLSIPLGDPDDQLGDLPALVSSGALNAAEFQNEFHSVDEYHIPIVVSTGADGELGLTGPLAADEPGQPALDARSDNIYSHEHQAGGN